MFELPQKKNGQRFRFRDYEMIQQAISALRPSTLSGTPGITQRVTQQGSSMDVADPLIPRWVFVTDFNQHRIQARFATLGTDGWGTLPTSFSGLPAPNYKTDHFAKFVVDDPEDIRETDRACLWMGGYFVPDFRMLLVDPAPESELCDDG